MSRFEDEVAAKGWRWGQWWWRRGGRSDWPGAELPLLRRRINKLKKYTTRCRKMRKSEIQRAAKTEAAGVVRKTVEYGMNFYRYLPGCLERQA